MKKITENIIFILKKNIPELTLIYIFGSFANKKQTKTSDIDIAILSNKKIDKLFLWELSQKISSVIKKDIDLIDLFDASTIFRFQIVNEGKLIYCKDKKKCSMFQNIVDSMYLELNMFRKKILENIKKRKQVY